MRCSIMSQSGIKKIITPDGEIHYRGQYICNVKPINEFKKDPAGNISKIMWIDPCDFKKYIEKKEFKEVVVERALDLRKKQNENTKN